MGQAIFDSKDIEGNVAFLYLTKALLSDSGTNLVAMPEKVDKIMRKLTQYSPKHSLVILSSGCLANCNFCLRMVIALKVNSTLIGVTAGTNFLFPAAPYLWDLIQQKGAFTDQDLQNLLAEDEAVTAFNQFQEAVSQGHVSHSAEWQLEFCATIPQMKTSDVCMAIKTMTNAFVPQLDLMMASKKIIDEQVRVVASRFRSGSKSQQEQILKGSANSTHTSLSGLTKNFTRSITRSRSDASTPSTDSHDVVDTGGAARVEAMGKAQAYVRAMELEVAQEELRLRSKQVEEEARNAHDQETHSSLEKENAKVAYAAV